MRKILILSFIICMVLFMTACTSPATDIVPTTTISDMNSNAIAILNECSESQSWDKDFIPTILAFVPDVFMLQEVRCACYTYFLIMSDGTEYCVITDENHSITSIFYNVENPTEADYLYKK